MFRFEGVLIAATLEQRLRVDEQNLACMPRLLLCTQDENGRRKAGAVEQVRTEADDRFDQVKAQYLLADSTLRAATEESTLREHHCDAPRLRSH